MFIKFGGIEQLRSISNKARQLPAITEDITDLADDPELPIILADAGKETFATEGRSAGQQWPRLKPRTILIKKQKGFIEPDKPMVATQETRTAATTPGSYEVSIVSKSRILCSLSGEPGKKGALHPERPIVLFSPDQLQRLARVEGKVVLTKIGITFANK